MKRYILTGTPGSGKTSILRRLQALGYDVVNEAATDVIARRQADGDPEPWMQESFIDDIVATQRRRQQRAAQAQGTVQVYDRSPICTAALSTYTDRPVSRALSEEIDRIIREQVYQPTVFFVRNLGFCQPTAARRITFEDSLRFERIHEETYRAFAYVLVDVPAATLSERAEAIDAVIRTPTPAR
ncbi:MAG: AAA family ATPase [Actinomycetota bacterium]|nr:AAA family ATPase [Actinomycetota bacterium]